MLSFVRNMLSGRSADFTFRRFHPSDEITLNKNTGLYIHIPFCKNSCPYCPYIKISHNEDVAEKYKEALKNEISLYYDLFGSRSFSSLYFGGGTPSLMVSGLAEVMDHLRKYFSIDGDIALETSPDEITPGLLGKLRSMGVNMLSLGVQSFNDRCLQKIGRIYNGKQALTALKQLPGAGFDSVNVDLIFAIDHQSLENIENDLSVIIDEKIDQVTCYPLFTFPFTEIGRMLKLKNIKLPGIMKRRKMYYMINDFLVDNGYRRTNVWSFSKNPVKYYSSVTRDHFLGLGTGSGSYNGRMYYFNTFSVPEYIKTTGQRLPVSVKMDVNPGIEKMIWLYWQLYNTIIDKEIFRIKFKNELENEFGLMLKLMKIMGFIEEKNEDIIRLNTRGAHWIHLVQNYFALDYVSKIWSASKADPWPEKIMI